MFSGIDDSDNNKSLPEIFQPYLQYVNKTFIDCDFNQVTVNWYMDGQDYIPFHKDCEIGMKGNKKICILTDNESDEEYNIRHLSFRPAPTPDNPALEKMSEPETAVRLHSGSMVIFDSEVQKYYKHGIYKSDSVTRRISLSFRQFEESQ